MKSAEEILADRIKIDSPETLYLVATDLQSLITQGLLKQIAGNCDINDIQRNKPFPDDIIDLELETIPGGSRYKLFCETYHGSGGEFRRITGAGSSP